MKPNLAVIAARAIAGTPRLRLLIVPPGSTFPLGFVTERTAFTLHRFDGTDAVDTVVDINGRAWYTVEPQAGTVLCDWQDPFGAHHFVLLEARTARKNAAAIARLTQYWTARDIMAQVGLPFNQAKEIVNGAGPQYALAAIALHQWLDGRRNLFRELFELVTAQNFSRLRILLAGSEFTERTNTELTHIIYGTRAYHRVIEW